MLTESKFGPKVDCKIVGTKSSFLSPVLWKILNHSIVHNYIIYTVLQVIFLIGNKSDLDAQRDVTYEEAKQFADENGEW